jgi:hypothetical protein
MFVIPALRRLRQEDLKFEANLGLSQKKKKEVRPIFVNT